MKKNVLMLVLVFAAATIVTAADDMFSYIPYKSAEWKQVTSVTTGEGAISTTQKVYYKEGKMRIEGKVDGSGPAAGTEFVSIMTNDEFITYDPKSKQGMTYPVESDNNPQKPAADMEKCRKSARKTGTEKVNGVSCGVYEYTCKAGGAQYRIKQWVSESDKFPMKTISESKGMKSVSLISGLNTSAKIDDSVFNPDKGVKIMDMAQMRGEAAGIEEMPEQAEVDDGEDSGEEFGETDEEKEAELEAKKEMLRQIWGQ